MNQKQQRAYCKYNDAYIYSRDYPDLCDFHCMAQTLENGNGGVIIEDELPGFNDEEGLPLFEGDVVGKSEMYIIRQGKFFINNMFGYGFYLENVETNDYVGLNSICRHKLVGSINKIKELVNR